MNNLNEETIRSIVREVLTEQLFGQANLTKTIDPSGVLAVKLPELNVSEEDRLDTGNPAHKVYCKDLVSLTESPRLGCGLMVMEDTTFDWLLEYDEIDYIIDGQLDVLIEGRKISAGPGEIILIPKDSKIQFSVTGTARFVYVTYPANWQNQ